MFAHGLEIPVHEPKLLGMAAHTHTHTHTEIHIYIHTHSNFDPFVPAINPFLALRWDISVDRSNAKKVLFDDKSRPHMYRIRGRGMGQLLSSDNKKSKVDYSIASDQFF